MTAKCNLAPGKASSCLFAQRGIHPRGMSMILIIFYTRESLHGDFPPWSGKSCDAATELDFTLLLWSVDSCVVRKSRYRRLRSKKQLVGVGSTMLVVRSGVVASPAHFGYDRERVLSRL